MKILDWPRLPPGGRNPQTPSSAKPAWHLLVIAVSASLYLYLRLFASPGVPYFVSGDQTCFWQYGLRMLHGEHVYKDFFQFTPPGTDLYFLLLFKIFGTRLWVATAGAILLGVALAITCFAISLRLMHPKAAVFTSLFFTVLVYGGHLDATHHWFSLIVSLSAVAVLFEDRSIGRLLLAGSLLAVAASFTQTSGVFVAVAILLSLAWEHAYGKPWKTVLRDQILLISSFCVVWLSINAYFLVTSGGQNLWYHQVIYPGLYVDAHRGFLVPSFRGQNMVSLSQRVFLYSLLLLLCPFVIFICFRRRKETSSRDMPFVLLAMAGVLLLVSVLTRSNWTRLYAVSMPSIILGISLVESCNHRLRRKVLIAIGILTVCLAAFQVRQDHRRKMIVTDLPAGRMAISPLDAEECRWLQANTKPGDNFFQAVWPGDYLPLELRSPVYVESLLPDRTPLEFVSLTIRQLQETKTKYILWSWYLQPDPHNPDDSLQPFRNYLESNYVRIHVFSNSDEIWQRRQM